MANKLYEETVVQDIADAIREKTGSEELMTVSEMPSEIRSITPKLQEKTIYTAGVVVPDEGYDGLSKVVVVIEVGGEEETPTVNSNFADNDWETIIKACQSNTVPDSWLIGDQKEMTVNGVGYMVDIIGKNHDEYTDGGTAPLTFQFHDCIGIYPIDAENNTSGGWEATDIRNTTLPNLLTSFPSVVQNAIRNVNKLTSSGSKSATLATTSDKLFLLSMFEILGKSHSYYLGTEGSQYLYYFSDETRKIKNYDGVPCNYFSRSPSMVSNTQWILIDSTGAVGYAYLANSRYISPAFCF